MQKSPFRHIVALALLLALLLPLSLTANAADLMVERNVYQFLTTELGLNSAAACGVLANMEAESGFSPTVYGDGGSSYGLCQWHNERFENLKSFCLLQGYDYWSPDGQLNYLAYELRTRYQSTYAALKRVSNTSDGAYEAAYYWCVNFEAPANREEAGALRGRTAQFKYWVRYGDSFSSPGSTTDLTSQGYGSSQSLWSDSNSGFYWTEEEEDTSEPTAPISTPSSAASTPAPRETAPAATAEPVDAEPQHRVRVPHFHYTPHHAPVSVQPALPAAAEPGSPLACLFLCAGEPGKRYCLPEPEASEPEPGE